MGLRFEWDEEKSVSNLRKHRISFDTALLVFSDPRHVTIPDREIDGEQRWHTIGLAEGALMLLVVHTVADDEEEEEETVRIISARKVIARERRMYEEGSYC